MHLSFCSLEALDGTREQKARRRKKEKERRRNEYFVED